MENENVIRQDMQDTRQSLTEKLETLESKIIGSVEEARAAVRETVTTVKETMHDGVETVKEAVDVRVQFERRPWLMLGGSVLCGFVLGSLFSGQAKGAPAEWRPLAERPPYTPGNGKHKPRSEQRSEQRSETPAETGAATKSWLASFEPEINQLKGLALGAALGTVREMLTDEVPPHMAERLREIIDAATEKIGGELMPSSDFAALTKPAASTDDGGFTADQPRW